MFASSREGEEAEFLRVLGTHRELEHAGWARRSSDRAMAGLRWLVVPRHPQRFDDVVALVREAGFVVARRSEWTDDDGPPAADVWIGDSLGEMAQYFGLADVALLGGSFLPLGGQNLIEAAACGCPVVMGPHTFNFADAAERAEAAGAALRVRTLDEGLRQAAMLAGDAPRRAERAELAIRFARAHRGAAAQTADAVLALVAQRRRA
jgi:3-deoxy-D-manno-octulosonic-acid transferase